MKEILEKFSYNYEKKKSSGEMSRNEQNSANNLIVFIFIGDKLNNAIEIIESDINEKWNNAKGIFYFSISSDKEKEDINKYNFQISSADENKKTLRSDICEEFYKNEEKLIALNKNITKIKNKILESGKIFSFCEKITISVITRADDPMNVITIPISLLLKTKFSESFKIVNLDLYEVLCENEEIDNVGYSSAVAMSFFKEIESAQSKEFKFEESINVQEEGIKLPVVSNSSQVFDTVYLLGDRNEKGYAFHEPLIKNFESIAYIHLLKNRNLSADVRDEINQRYEENSFKRGIGGKNYRGTYISAGLSKVNTPDKAIGAAVIESFYENLLNVMKELSNINMDNKMQIFSIDKESLENKTKCFIVSEKKLQDMNAIMPLIEVIPVSELQNMSLHKIEKKLYGEGCINFFERNFRETTYKNLKEYKIREEIKNSIMKDIISNKAYGIYCGYVWTSESEILEQVRKEKRNLEEEIENRKKELEEVYNETIELPMQYLLPFFARKAVDKAKIELFERIYNRKFKILKTEIKQKILEEYEETITEVHEELKKHINELEEIKSEFKKNSVSEYNTLEYSSAAYFKDNIKNLETYAGQNIKLYYNMVVLNIIKELEKQFGKNFYFEDKFIGDISALLDKGKEELCIRIIKVCEEHIFNKKPFYESFEDEMQNRATVPTEYNNNKVLSKKELFEKLYELLEEGAKPSVYLSGFNTENKYEEKYLFGDYNCDFIRYAFDYDKTSRIYRLGCVHENKANGIAKLTLMGGFYIENLMYYKNCSKYYDIYIEKGFKLHFA